MKRHNPALTIQIPKPCSQPWEKMTPEAGGRHCAACAQTVTDFTRMTDAQISELLRSNAGGCGRFRAEQLNRELITPPAEKRFPLNGFYKVAASLLLVFSAGKVAAQEKELPVQELVLKAPQSMSNSVIGIVTDTNGEPLTGAEIKVQGFQSVHIAGIDGEFEMDIPDSAFKDGRVLISVFYVGHRKEEMLFSGGDFPLLLRIKLMRDMVDPLQKGGFEILPKAPEEVEKVYKIDVRKSYNPESELVVGKISTSTPAYELRARERELQYKQRENRSEEFIQDYGH